MVDPPGRARDVLRARAAVAFFTWRTRNGSRPQTLDAIALHARKTEGRPRSPKLQLCCCIDEREESFRRHLEELEPGVETFGAAGFYSVAMYYRGASDAHFVPLCPVVIRPQHWVTEEVDDGQGETHRRRARTRKVLGTASHRFHVGTRSFALGALLSGAVGVLASFPLLARILFPRLTAQFRRKVGNIVHGPRREYPASARAARSRSRTGPENGHVGYSVDEMANIGERLLRDIGLTSGFARLFVLLGHGSDSLNNPHNSAYNCGACGGASRGPKRLGAMPGASAQARPPRPRSGSPGPRPLSLPDDLVFVGGYHNTCNDSVTFSDLDRIPESHRREFETVQRLIAATCERNAHERCRRFMSAPLTISFAEAQMHVEERAEDLAQTRPELGHATNAITIVGRREWTRGLYLDRRAFLTSYDPTQDDAQGSILLGLLSAVVPVCAGINLEYYFSNVDNVGFGAGTKLPHNLASLLGVMDGRRGERPGGPGSPGRWSRSTCEPVRSLFILETTAEIMQGIIERDEMIGRHCKNGWVILTLIHPETREIRVYRDGRFVPYQPQATVLPRAASSVEWYRGWRDHLEFAEIER